MWRTVSSQAFIHAKPGGINPSDCRRCQSTQPGECLNAPCYDSLSKAPPSYSNRVFARPLKYTAYGAQFWLAARSARKYNGALLDNALIAYARRVSDRNLSLIALQCFSDNSIQ